MAADSALRLSPEVQKNLVQFCRNVLDRHQRNHEIRSKFEFIDIAYARYKQLQQNGQDGVDRLINELEYYGINDDDITIPIVVSHVDSYVGYFADVFLSGYPIFPVVSGPQSRKEAEILQTIIHTHATQGRYARQMLLSFFDCSKYNLSALEIDWCPLNDYAIMSSYKQITQKQKLETQSSSYNKVNRIDPYNFIYDQNMLPVDVPYKGEVAGYIELVSAVQLARDLSYYGRTGNGYNTSQAKFSDLTSTPKSAIHGGYYTEAPQISKFLSGAGVGKAGFFDWDMYLTGKKGAHTRYYNCYEKTTIYARIIPSFMGMAGIPAPNTPQVWKLVFINHDKLVYAARQYNIYDTLPIYIAQPFEDGLGMQTQSLAENGIAFQEAASKLMTIRLAASRRAVMDRALYDPQMINPAHLDTPMPAPKIPIRDNSKLNGKTLTDAYMQIPFDSRGTETVIQDMTNLVAISDRMNGINQPFQGQFQKGNKTRKEWVDTMEGANNRLRLRALNIEYQQLLPIKEQIKFNIYQFGVTGGFQNPKSGTAYEVDEKVLQDVKDKIGTFEVADGFHPSEKIASTEVLLGGMNTIANSPILQQSWGTALPEIFAHMMSLGGVKDIDKYLPQQASPAAAPVQQGPAAPPV